LTSSNYPERFVSELGCQWNLRALMAARGMFATSDLVPLLAERGVHLSREQVYRLVTGLSGTAVRRPASAGPGTIAL
jgi:hypothetical protein